MPKTKRRKTLNRIFAAICALWIVWLLVIIPMQLRHRAEARLGERMAGCVHAGPDHGIVYDGPCMDLAEHLYVIDKDEARSYFRPESLIVVASAAFGLPAAVYFLMLMVARRMGRRDGGADDSADGGPDGLAQDNPV